MKKRNADGFIVEDEAESMTAWSWDVYAAAALAGALVATIPVWLASLIK